MVRDELTRHWYPHAFDAELGGFHQTFARDWSQSMASRDWKMDGPAALA